MSVTFWFKDDDKYTEEYDCHCAEWHGEVKPDCPRCNGTGVETFTSDVNAINFSNSNAAFLLKLAGFPDDAYLGGEMPAREMADRMQHILTLTLFGPADIKQRAMALYATCIAAGDRNILWG